MENFEKSLQDFVLVNPCKMYEITVSKDLIGKGAITVWDLETEKLLKTIATTIMKATLTAQGKIG